LSNDINRSLGLDGAGYTTTIDGKAWTFMPLTQGMKAKFSAWMLDRARRTAMESERFYRREAQRLRQEGQAKEEALSATEREELVREILEMDAAAARQMTEFNERAAAGEYHFDGRVCNQAKLTVDGACQIILLSLEPKHPGVTLPQAEDLFVSHNKAVVEALREATNLGKLPAPSPSAA